MDIFVIASLIVGVILLVLGYVLPMKKEETYEQTRELAKEEIATLVSLELDKVQSHVDDVVQEAVTYAVEKTERSMERLSNEKIMAVNEYSDTVMRDIHKNHEEVLFLYDMLNDKQKNIKDTVIEVDKAVKAVKEATQSVQEQQPQVQPKVKTQPNPQVQEKTPMQPKMVSEPQKVSEASESEGFTFLQAKTGVKKENVINKAATSDTPKQNTAPFHRPVPATNDMLQPRDAAIPAEGGSAPSQGASGQNSNEKILQMYKQGKSKLAIAKELGLGVGEVKLVIDLNHHD